MYAFGFIGAGRVTRFMIQAMIRAGGDPRRVAVDDTDPLAIQTTLGRFPDVERRGAAEIAASSEILFLAVHPPAIEAVLRAVAPSVGPETAVISLAPRCPIDALASMLPPGVLVARVIPNAPAALGRGFNPAAFADPAGARSRELLARLSFLGDLPVVPEPQLEAWALVTGMGPTYFWFQMLLLERIATRLGIDQPLARKGIAATLEGSAALLASGTKEAREVLDLVPIHPLREDEGRIGEIYEARLGALFSKLSVPVGRSAQPVGAP